MVRTKADSCPAAGRKVVAARAPRKNVGASSSSSGSSSSTSLGASPAGKYAGGNPVCPRPTPDWQKGISSFFSRKPSNKENQEPEASEEEPGCSGSSTESATCQPGASSASSSSSSSKPCAGSSSGSADTAGPSRTQAASEDEDES